MDRSGSGGCPLFALARCQAARHPRGNAPHPPRAGQCVSVEKFFKKNPVFFLSKFIDIHENVCYHKSTNNKEDNDNERNRNRKSINESERHEW